LRYALRPHRGANAAQASRFAIGLSQPLLVATASELHTHEPLLRIEPADVLVQELKPSDDGKAWIVRLFNASDVTLDVRLTWSARAKVRRSSRSNLAEQPLVELPETFPMIAGELMTLRASR
jgi:alpha-mannosidase